MWSVLLCLPEGDPHLWPSFLKSLHHQLVDCGCHLSSQFLCQFSKLKQFNSHFKFTVGSWSSSTLATWCKELTHWKRPWCWGSLKAGGEGEDRGWDGWMAPSTQWTWVWASSRTWWRMGKPGMLQAVGSQRVTPKQHKATGSLISNATLTRLDSELTDYSRTWMLKIKLSVIAVRRTWFWSVAEWTCCHFQIWEASAPLARVRSSLTALFPLTCGREWTRMNGL